MALTLHFRSAPWGLATNLLFWAALLGFLTCSDRALAGLLCFCPLWATYFLTFRFSRPVIERWDYVFNSDTARYLQEAMAFLTTPRHLGFPVITFPLALLDELGSRYLGIPRLGREYLYLQCALVGCLAVKLLCKVLAADIPSKRLRILTACGFACSLATWAFSSVIETFMLSALLFLATLHHLRAYSESGTLSSFAPIPGLALVALCVSIENIYLVALFVLTIAWRAALYRRAPAWSHLIICAGMLAAGILSMLWIAERGMGPGCYAGGSGQQVGGSAEDIIDHLHRFTSDYRPRTPLTSVGLHAGLMYRVFVMSVRAQLNTRPQNYTRKPRGQLRPTAEDLIYYGSFLTLVVMAGRGLWLVAGGGDQQRRLLVALLAVTLVLRHAFMFLFATQQCILFSLPSILCMWMLVATGTSRLVSGRSKAVRLLVGACFWAIVVLLVLTNLAYLLQIQIQ
ncbi:MAG: hypothetical protein AB1714_22610 [Acidobacteriota bacterium]